MAKAMVKVPTTGKEDLSGWEKRYTSLRHLSISSRFVSRRGVSRVGLSAAHKASSLSVTRGRRPTRRPLRAALLLFIAAVLIDILGRIDQSMPALDCIYGPASTRRNQLDAPS